MQKNSLSASLIFFGPLLGFGIATWLSNDWAMWTEQFSTLPSPATKTGIIPTVIFPIACGIIGTVWGVHKRIFKSYSFFTIAFPWGFELYIIIELLTSPYDGLLLPHAVGLGIGLVIGLITHFTFKDMPLENFQNAPYYRRMK